MLQRPSSRRQRRAQLQRTYRRRLRAGRKLTEVTAAVVEFLIEGEWLKPAEAAPSVRSPRRSVANSASKAMIARQPEGRVHRPEQRRA